MTLLPGMEPLPPGESDRERRHDLRMVVALILLLAAILGLAAILMRTHL